MNYLKIILIFQISFFTFGQSLKTNVLTIRNSAKKSKSYKITKISKIELGPEKGSGILVETTKDVICVIPINKIIETPRVKYAGCTGCMKTDEELESHYSQMFLNGVDANVSCDVIEDEVVGFEFFGATTIDEEGMFTSYGMTFDMAQYREGPFAVPEKGRSSIERFLRSAGKVILKYSN